MCGVVGLIGTPDASREAFLALTTLQHRGQDAAGILSYDAAGFHPVKNLGLVESVFNRDNMNVLTGNMAIGHARYSTIGRGDLSDVQPFLINYPFGIGMVHNGNIVNCEELAASLKAKRRHLLTSSDSETILNMLADGLAKASAADDAAGASGGSDNVSFEQICESVKEIFTKVNGSYSIVSMIAGGGLLAFRDPYGIRPLVWGKRQSDQAQIFCSEAVALNFLGYELVRDVQPGEVVYIDMAGKVFSKVIDQRKPAHCMFEWIYFASPESVIDGVPVYGARIHLGKNLARLIKNKIQERGIEADIVVPVPETARIAAIALSEELGIPYREVLIKNRYIKRTFILDSQDKRQKAVNLKLSPVRSEIAGKKVILVDDSIVRGTTSKKIIELVRQAGASKVYFVSTCPPIKNPCYYGIDFPSTRELIAAERDVGQIEKELGADAVIYQDLEGLQSSISKDGKRPCMACLDGKYPTDVSRSGKAFSEKRTEHRAQQAKG
jgi:amidophosphoribosyltransferase